MSKYRIIPFTAEWRQKGHSIAEYTMEPCPYRQTCDHGVIGLGSHKCQKCPHCVKRDLEARTVECSFDILDLSLTYHWYDEIESGRKCEEYRELTYYWYKRLLDPKGTERLNRLEDAKEFRKYDAVRFHRGQGGKQTMMYEVGDIRIGYGNVKDGAPADKKCFVIRLGKRLQ
jgi:hypothetical protein